MDKKKVTRRAAIGAAIGTIAVSPFIIRALKERHAVPIPSSGTGTVKITKKYRGRDITVNVPLKRPSTPQEQKEVEEQIMAQLKKNPIYVEAEAQARNEFRDEFRDKNRKKTIEHFADLEKQQLANLAKRSFTEEEKQAAARAIKESIRTGRAKCLSQIDKVPSAS